MLEILRADVDFDQVTERGADGREIILVQTPEGLRGYRNVCPHVGVGLDWGDGRCLDESGEELVCAMHGARFRATDGAVISGPCARGLTPVPVRVEDGKVVLDAHQ